MKHLRKPQPRAFASHIMPIIKSIPPTKWLWAALLPNLPLSLIAALLSLGRPIINLDYSLCGLLISSGHAAPGAILALFFLALDAIALIGQIIPLPHLSDLIYLASFSPLLAKRHLLLLGILGSSCILSWVMLIKSYRRIPVGPSLAVAGIVAALSLTSTFTSKDIRFYRMESSLAGSQAMSLLTARSDLFVSLAQMTGGELKPLTPGTEYASSALETSKALRVLLIVAESWGMPRDPNIQRTLLAPLTSNSLVITGEGQLNFDGMTLAAEIRELCHASLLGYNLRYTTEGFGDCLPNTFQAAGYATAALHGAGGPMYDRIHWYPRAGFQKSEFFENMDISNRCHSFPGACDLDLMERVSDYFSEPGKRFMYWLTLNSHAPYDKRDIRYEAFDCARHKVPESSETCRNLKLQAQFFSGLGKLIDSGRLKDIDVLIVGDHPPVLLDRAEKEEFFQPNTVPWLRFTTR